MDDCGRDGVLQGKGGIALASDGYRARALQGGNAIQYTGPKHTNDRV
jgi:hypothetical protein